MTVTEVTAENFDSLVNESEYAVVDCYGDFCGACVLLEPVYREAASQMAGVSFLQINISQYQEISERFGIDAMPTLLFFRNGTEVSRFVGSTDREGLNREISKMLYC